MRLLKWCRLAAVTAFVVVAGPTMAQNCAGFTDVSSGDPNCASYEWLKNRQITLGCTATTYCPNQTVTRAAMALFMHRLGTALTPIELAYSPQDTVNAVSLNAPGQVLCKTNLTPFTVTGGPRRATFNNKANLYNATARVDVLAEAVYSTDNGGSWTAVPDSQTYQTLNSGGTPSDDVSTYQLGYVDLSVGQTYIFGTRVLRAPGTAGSGNVAVYCVTRVSIGNRNGQTSPYDERGVLLYEENRVGRAALPPGP